MSRLEIKNVSYRYKNADHFALSNVSCAFEPGQVTAVVGPSGSGKTTLLSIMVSTMPIREFSSCSTTIGIRSAISAPEGYSIFSLSIWLLSYKRLLSPLARIIPLPRH